MDTDTDTDKDNITHLQDSWILPPTIDDNFRIHSTLLGLPSSTFKPSCNGASTPVVDLTINSSSNMNLGDVIQRFHARIPFSKENMENKPVQSSQVPHFIDLNTDDPFDEEDEVMPYTGPKSDEEFMASL
jgi:hypothetical protein